MSGMPTAHPEDSILQHAILSLDILSAPSSVLVSRPIQCTHGVLGKKTHSHSLLSKTYADKLHFPSKGPKNLNVLVLNQNFQRSGQLRSLHCTYDKAHHGDLSVKCPPQTHVSEHLLSSW